MTDSLFSLLVLQLQRHRTWIDVVKPGIRHEFFVNSGGALMPGLFRSIVLVCCDNHHGYNIGKRWIVPEFDIDNAIRELCADAEFSLRLQYGIITTNDAQHIIHHATYGIINPELKVSDPTLS